MSVTSPEEMIIVSALRRSFESTPIAGNSVNIGLNPFTPALVGTFDLLQAARLALNDLDQHRTRLAEQAKKEQEEAAAKARMEEPF
jgi:hypothetical protein